MNYKTTIILVTYNHEKYIKESLNSIINQINKFDEIIIVDNNSMDQTIKIIEEIINNEQKNISFIKNSENYGVNEAINIGVWASSGDLIYLQSGDDVSHLNRNKISLDEINKNNEFQLYVSSYEIIDQTSKLVRKIIRSGAYRDPRELIKKGAGLPPMGIVIKRELFKKIGKLNPSVANEDDILGFSAVLYGGVKIIENNLYKYRMHQNSMSGWSTFESDQKLYLDKFFNNLNVRIDNYREWKRISEESNHKDKNIFNDMLDKKIKTTEFIKDIKSINIYRRFKLFINYYNFINKSEFLVILFKENGALLYQKLRSIRYS